MGVNKKSPKDMAFDKERATYRKQIRELESQVKKELVEKYELKKENEKLQDEIFGLKEWIERLLEYTELSEDDMKKIIEKEKLSLKVFEHLSGMEKLFGRLGTYGL